MMSRRIGSAVPSILRILTLAAMAPGTAAAHCDGMDGPVVKAAQRALATGDVNLVLIWVRKSDEAEIRDAFTRTLAVRKVNREARDLADRYFFETLVRVHRAGEGAPYTGLKPAGRDLGPAIPLADKALATGELEPLIQLITAETRAGLAARFDQAMKARRFESADLEAGRAYIRTYVAFIHFAESAHTTAVHPEGGHYPEPSGMHEEHD